MSFGQNLLPSREPAVLKRPGLWYPPSASQASLPTQAYTCQERRRADLLIGAKERIWWTYYDSEYIDKTDTTTRNQYFFRRPIGVDGKTRIRTNMTTAGQLPDPQEFIVHFCGVYNNPWIEGTGATFQDWMTIANNVMLKLVINQKVYYESLSWDLPSGGGQRAFAMPGSLSDDEYGWNGDMSQIAIKRLYIPCYIMQNQSFYWEVEMDNTAYDTLTDNAKLAFYVLMHGELYRAIT